MRLAAGRARALGLPTRGTTAAGRLRRVDRWLAATQGHLLNADPHPLVVDLGFGDSPVTTLELASRLRARCAAPGLLDVLGVDLDPARVARACRSQVAGVRFAHGGFELGPAGTRRPVIVRAMNVLRQYPVGAVGPAWASLTGRLADGGLLLDGSCDETGHLACWLALDRTGPRSLTLSADLGTVDRPAAFAARLPKALVELNVPGEPVHALLAALDAAWTAAAPLAVFGVRQRFAAAVAAVRHAGWPVLDGRRRARRGELTVAAGAVTPLAGWPR